MGCGHRLWWMNLEWISAQWKNLTPKTTQHTIPLRWNIQNMQMHRQSIQAAWNWEDKGEVAWSFICRGENTTNCDSCKPFVYAVGPWLMLHMNQHGAVWVASTLGCEMYSRRWWGQNNEVFITDHENTHWFSAQNIWYTLLKLNSMMLWFSSNRYVYLCV